MMKTKKKRWRSDIILILTLPALPPPPSFIQNPFAHLNRLHKIKRPPVEEDLFEGTRYVPSIKSVIEDHLRGAIPEEIFPYTIPPPELPGNSLSDMIKGGGSAPILRSTKPSWATKKTSGAASGSGVGGASSATSMSAAAAPKMYGDKIIVFVLGGISYSEIRSAYELMKSVNREVIIGKQKLVAPPFGLLTTFLLFLFTRLNSSLFYWQYSLIYILQFRRSP